MEYRLFAVALCATLLLSGCTGSGFPPPTSTTSGVVRESSARAEASDADLASCDSLRFNKKGLVRLDCEVLGWGSGGGQDSARSGSVPASPVLVKVAGSGAKLPVFLLGDSKFYNAAGERITAQQFCALMVMNDSIRPVCDWRLTVRREEGDRLALVKATAVARP